MVADRLAFHLTDRCQLNCDHCIRDPGLKAVDLDFDLAVRILDEAVRELGTREVSLTGGEPTLYPRFVDLAAEIAARGARWNMVTNGIGLARTLVAIRQRCGSLDSVHSIVISVDGHDAASHDAIRGRGSFHAVLDAVSTCVAFGIPFILQATIHARNASSMEPLVVLADDLGASELRFGATLPTGTFLDAGLHLDVRAYRALREDLERAFPRPPLPIAFSAQWPDDHPLQPCRTWLGDPVHVDYQGRMTLCCVLAGSPSSADATLASDVIADLRDTPLRAAYPKFLEQAHAARVARARQHAERGLDGWDTSKCNWCARAHGKPHWQDRGADGPAAERARWRGAWAPEKHPLHPNHATETAAPTPDRRRAGS